MNKFFKELETGEIHQRDRWQFELKSEYELKGVQPGVFTQEIYLFIPNALHINPRTYSKESFFLDLTNLIRYKTPLFSLTSLVDPKNILSPLHKIKASKSSKEIAFELKLLANIVRSSLREEIRAVIEENGSGETIAKELEEFLHEFSLIKTRLAKEELKTVYHYVDEFINDTSIFYLTTFLNFKKNSSKKISAMLFDLLSKLELHREKNLHLPTFPPEPEEAKEEVLYRSSLLNKYVLDALLLNTTREPVVKRIQPFVGAISAGIAMLFFFVLFVWQGQVFVINSMPFILITVLLYIIKDRIKEGLRSISFDYFSTWFSDWNTKIKTPDGEHVLGEMTETFSLLRDDNIPSDVKQVREKEFHTLLKEIQRPESVICYKNTLEMFGVRKRSDIRRKSLNAIFRFNISKFLQKADEPSQPYICYDPEGKQFTTTSLPKVYHINVILKNKVNGESFSWKKFRIVINKKGIKRVESLS